MNTLPSDILQIIYKNNSIIRLLSKEIRTLLSIGYSTLVLNYYDTTDSLNVNVAKLEYVNTTKIYNHLRLLSLYPKVIRFLDIKTNKLSICPNEHCYEEEYVMKRKLPPLKELYITDNVRDHTFIIDKNTEIVKIALVSEKNFAPKSLINLQSINDSCIVSFELIFYNSKYSNKYCTKQWLSFFDSVNVSNKKVIYEFENKRVSLFKSIFVPKKIISAIYEEKENYISINKNDTNVLIDLTSCTSSTNIVIKGNNSSLNELFIKSASNRILKLEFYQDTFESIKRFYVKGNFRFVNKLDVCQIKDLMSCDIRLDGDSHRILTSKNIDSEEIGIVKTNYNDFKSDFPLGVDKIQIILHPKNAPTMYTYISDKHYLVQKIPNLEILDLSDFEFNYLEIKCGKMIFLHKIILKTKNELLNVIVDKNVSVTFSNKVKIQNLYLMDESSIIKGDYVILNLFCQVTYNTKNINYISKYIISGKNY